ncbi:hypothetical protein [Nocardia seriolae]|uniref:hypothetical protein n=1 Tax=Nocardia seriolae TaxID=37332 RepID=UPI0029538721|nr:hypothetical protein [Nocardia seriolae]BEK86768.1 hypothetical protein NSERKGN1266_27190 [Nocardia seriolae]
MDPEALRRRAAMSQSGAEHEQTDIAGRGTDPDYIRRLEDFDRFSHEQIHRRVQAMNPGDMHRVAETWISIADSMFGALTVLHASVQSTLADGMAGNIADAAAASARRFVRDATDIAEIAQSTGHRRTAAAYGAEAVRKTVPPPLIHGSPNVREKQRQIALAALDANYTPIYPPAGSGIPAFFTVMAPGDEAAGEDWRGARDSGPTPGAPEPGPGPGTSGTSPLIEPASYARDGSDGTDEPGAQSPDTSMAGTNPADARDISRTGARGDTLSPGYVSPNTDDRSRRDSSDLDTRPATIAPPENPLTTGRTPPPTGKPAAPARPHATPATPDPGHSFPGPLKPGTPTQPRSLTPADGPGSSGSAIPPGLFTPGSRAGTDPDSAHRCPPWLIRDRQDELLGSPLPHVPPTLGAEFPSARYDLTPPEHSLD